jgi:hypothetical protein
MPLPILYPMSIAAMRALPPWARKRAACQLQKERHPRWRGDPIFGALLDSRVSGNDQQAQRVLEALQRA